MPHTAKFRTVLFLAAILRIILVLYGAYQDVHSDLKYTDVDYRVFTDAAGYVLDAKRGRPAAGPLVDFFGWNLIGDPYVRDTYRYTPLLAILLIPNHIIHPAFGKLLFSVCDIIIGVLLLRLTASSLSPSQSSKASLWVGAIWLLNPMVANISTRGSAESVLGLAIVYTLALLIRRRFDAAAITLGFAVHFKLYPFIYGTSVLAYLSSPKNIPAGAWLGELKDSLAWRRRIRFTAISVTTLIALNAVMYGIWGQPFLQHTYLYHLTRRDHRHNFSLYFYPTYLAHTLGGTTILRSPLLSFVPQMALSLGTGFIFGKDDLPFAWFVQTTVFVLFNKVCTSQYFMWYMWFLPLILPRLRLGATRTLALVAIWVGAQALWLSLAYQLEFLGKQVFLSLWSASAIFLVANCYVLVEVVKAYR